MIKTPFALVCAIALACPANAQHFAQGKIKVCKEGLPNDWAEEGFWAKEEVIPTGAVFKDAGEVGSKDPTEGLIRLRIVTSESASIRGKQKCAILNAYIPEDQGDWGTLYAAPVRTSILRSDKRLLVIERWGDGQIPPPKLAPWDDVVPVEATIESDFR